MKKIILLLLLLFCFLCKAQNAQDIIIGLKKELATKPDEKRRAVIYSDLTWYYGNIAIDSSMYYGDKALNSAIKLNDSTLMAQVYSDLGSVYFKKSDYSKSKESYLKAYAIRKIRNDEKGMVKINVNLANIYQTQGNLRAAMSNYLSAYEYFSKLKEENQVVLIKGNIGALYYEMKDYTKALKYINEVIKYFEINNLRENLCRNYLTKGNVLLAMKDTLESVKAYNKGLIYCNEVGDKFTVSKCKNNLAIVKQAQNKIAESKKLFDEVTVQRKDYNSDGASYKKKLNDSYTLLLEKKYLEAKKILLAINPYFIEKKLDYELSTSYKYLVPIYAKLNMSDSVIHYQTLYERAIENAVKISVVKETAELETKYQTAKKEKLILEKEIEVKKKNNLIYSLLIIALFISLVGFLIYRQQKLKNTQQEQEFKLKEAISEIENQNNLHEQRLSISRDLHDNIGAQLTFIISSVDNLQFANQKLDTKINTQLSKISNFTKSTIIELRDTIWAMNSNEFTFEDLRSRIFNFIEKAQSSQENIQFNFTISDAISDLKISALLGISIYRTIQEAVNNAIKYANASTINVAINQFENLIEISIIDNGKGFDLDNTVSGNGLLNMRKRIEEIDGKFEINSIINKGTKINFNFKKL